MPALLLYLLQVNGALLLFYATYWLVLRRLTFYTLNRGYLVFAVVFSVAYPLVEVHAWLTQPVVLLPTTQIVPTAWSALPPSAAPTPTTDYWAILAWAYWAGVGLLGLRLLGQLAALYRIHRTSWPAQWRGQAYRRVGEEVNPFSFGMAIYLNPDQHAEAELPAILYHEQVHVRQWHTADIVLAQLLQAFCWFNPVAWLLRRAVQENLEFITDRQVLRADLLDAKAYQYSLVRLSTVVTGTALVNHFAFLTLKSRIAMLNKKRSATAYLGCYALLVPGMTVFLFACSSPEVDPVRPAKAEAPSQAAYTVRDSTLFFLDGKPSTQAALAAVPNEEISSVTGLGYGGYYRSRRAYKPFGPGINGFELVITKAGENSEAVRVFRQKHGLKSPAEWKKEEAERPMREAAQREEIRKQDSAFALLPPALFVLNGKPTTEEKVSQLEYATVEHVRVLKGKEATELYGEQGRNDVVLVTTKKP